MPMPIIHLCVAEKLADKLKIADIPAFYLGSVSPDAYDPEHTYFDIDGVYEEYLAAHLCDSDFSAWKSNVRAFLSEKTGADRDFYLGYCVHILTDIYWKETVYGELEKKLPSNSWEETRAVYYYEAEQIDYELYMDFKSVSNIISCLSASEAIGIRDLITVENVKARKESILSLFRDFDNKKRENSLQYLTYNMVVDFISNAAEEIDL